MNAWSAIPAWLLALCFAILAGGATYYGFVFRAISRDRRKPPS